MAKKKVASKSKPKPVTEKKAVAKSTSAKLGAKASVKKSSATKKKVAKAPKTAKPAKAANKNSQQKLDAGRKSSTKKTPKIATKKKPLIKPMVVAEVKSPGRRAKKAAAAPSTGHTITKPSASTKKSFAGGAATPPDLTSLDTNTVNWLGGVIDFISKAAQTGTIAPDSGGPDIDFAKPDVVPESGFSKLRVGIRVGYQLKNKFRANKVKTEEKEQTDSADRFSGKVSFISKAAETGTIAPDKGGPDVDFTKQDVVPQKAFNGLKVEDPASYELKTLTRAVNVKPS